jgi:hypothetical protein
MAAFLWYDMIYLLTAIGLTPGGSSTVHIYTLEGDLKQSLILYDSDDAVLSLESHT